MSTLYQTSVRRWSYYFRRPVWYCKSVVFWWAKGAFFIGGYLASKLKGNQSPGSEQVRNFTETISRGGLSLLCEELFQFVICAYSFFVSTQEQHCRKCLVSILTDFISIFHINIAIPNSVISRLVNIFLKRFCEQSNEDSSTTQSQKRKIAKLSSSSSNWGTDGCSV